MSCPGGMSQLGHVLNENASIFPGDPETTIDIFANIADDGYLVEDIGLATHTGTHLDAPGHFIEGGRTVDQLDATEFTWPAYVIDVRDRMAQADAAGAVQWMVDRRGIDAIGSDTFGPDATSDGDFGATFTILDNDGLALPGLNNVDSLSINGDIVSAGAVRLEAGSGYQVNPLACHARNAGHGQASYTAE